MVDKAKLRIMPPRCPECGALLIQVRRGAKLQSYGPGYACPYGHYETKREEKIA